ncbi:hypothetical protein LQZ18_11260 [Lachnospiraceae bacterium ZAX-1]
MIWYRNMYASENIAHKKERIKWKIKHNAGQINIYVIALAANPKNLLEIIPAIEMMQKAYPKKDMFIVGIAKGYEEAVDLIVQIIMEVYRATDGFQVRDYFGIEQA